MRVTSVERMGRSRFPSTKERVSNKVQIPFIIKVEDIGILILLVPYAKLAAKVSAESAITSKRASSISLGEKDISFTRSDHTLLINDFIVLYATECLSVPTGEKKDGEFSATSVIVGDFLRTALQKNDCLC